MFRKRRDAALVRAADSLRVIVLQRRRALAWDGWRRALDVRRHLQHAGGMMLRAMRRIALRCAF